MKIPLGQDTAVYRDGEPLLYPSIVGLNSPPTLLYHASNQAVPCCTVRINELRQLPVGCP